MAGNEIRIRAWVKDEVSSSLSKMRDKFDLLGKGAASASLAGNLGAMALAKGVGLASSALSQLGDVAGDAIAAAIAEEKSLAKLGAALEANVEDWDGNTTAIEKALQARIRLGFADDEQRESLATLVAVTKDATKALELQRTAMDLARLRNIDLAAASDIVGKVYGGNIGILSRYGIQLEKGISATEAIAKVQQLAAGQAEAYANTTGGKLLAAQTRIDEAMEKFGGVTLPLVADGASAVADVVEGLANGFDVLNGKVPESRDEVAGLEQNFIGLFGALGSVLPGFALVSDAMDTTKTKVEKLDKPIEGIQDAFDDMGDEAKSAARKTEKSFTSMVDTLVGETQRLIDDVFDPIEIRSGIYQDRMDQNAAEEKLRDAKTAREKREATDDILTSIGDQADALVDLGKTGKLTSKDVDRFEKDVKQSYDVLGKEVPKDIQRIIAKLRELDQWDGHKVNVTVKATGVGLKGGDGGTRERRAKGGPTKANDVYMVGEEGPELFVSDKAGTIIPNHKLTKGGGGVGPMRLGGGGDINIHLHGMTYPPSPAQLQAIARELGPALRDYDNRRG